MMGIISSVKNIFRSEEKPIPIKRQQVIVCDPAGYDLFCGQGYTPLSRNPEVRICVDRIADLISSMTIQLMVNMEKGDVRVRNGLSKKIDVDPSQYLTRKDWMQLIVRALLLEGEGNAVVIPKIDPATGLLSDLFPVPPSAVSFRPAPDGYQIMISGKAFDPSDLIHFKWKIDPDCVFWGAGVRVLLGSVLGSLTQANATIKDFFRRPRPSIVVSVDSTEDLLHSKEGRQEIFDRYADSVETGNAWVVPGEIIKVEQLKPLSLKDLAISDQVNLDRRFIAALFGVPRFFLGTDQYNRGEYNHFITTQIMHICQIIAQELTAKILIQPCMYFRFNPRSLFDYSLTELSNIGIKLAPVGIITKNEARDWIGLDPSDAEGMDEFAMLENYIPVGMAGDQEKLKGGDDDE